jgi:hypothetical protein
MVGIEQGKAQLYSCACITAISGPRSNTRGYCVCYGNKCYECELQIQAIINSSVCSFYWHVFTLLIWSVLSSVWIASVDCINDIFTDALPPRGTLASLSVIVGTGNHIHSTNPSAVSAIHIDDMRCLSIPLTPFFFSCYAFSCKTLALINLFPGHWLANCQWSWMWQWLATHKLCF